MTGVQTCALPIYGIVKLNGKLVTEKRKKVFPGDVVNIEDQIELTITKEA